MEINLIFSSWRMALQLLARDCLILCVIDGAESNSVLKQDPSSALDALLNWEEGFVSSGSMTSATFTGEVVADVPVCKFSRSCLLYTFVIMKYSGLEWTHKDH